MIKSITVTNYLGDSIKLDLARPELSGFAVTSITGLGPGTATINTTEMSTSDGSLFNSARLPARNIVISLKYLWLNSIEEVRQRSYKYFPIKKKVKLQFETDNRNAEIEGYVESNDPTIFSNSEGSDISIICPYPFFYSTGNNGITTTVFYGAEPLFEFPFSNESSDQSLIRMGALNITANEKTILYRGDAEIGVTISMHAVGDASNVTIYNVATQEMIRIDTDKLEAFTGSGIKAGDDIVICTVKGSKSVTLMRDGDTINILNCLDKNTNWFQLTKGDNVFAYTADKGAANLQIVFSNRTIYEGV